MGRWDKAGTEGGSSSFPFPAVLTLELLQSHALKREQQTGFSQGVYFQKLPRGNLKLYIFILIIFVKRKTLSNPTYLSPNQITSTSA